jgi:5-hydroxyisourate hydrolase
MAQITSHTLNGMDGTHAGGIKVLLKNLSSGETLFSTLMDDGGRLSQDIDASVIDLNATYELVFDCGAYWYTRNQAFTVGEIALRFKMTDADARYHMPVILNPNSYSMWASS